MKSNLLRLLDMLDEICDIFIGKEEYAAEDALALQEKIKEFKQEIMEGKI